MNAAIIDDDIETDDLIIGNLQSTISLLNMIADTATARSNTAQMIWAKAPNQIGYQLYHNWVRQYQSVDDMSDAAINKAWHNAEPERRNASSLDEAADDYAGAGAALTIVGKEKQEAKKAAQLASGLPYGFTVSKDGVYFTPEGTDDKPGTPIRICSPLRVTALIRDRSSENWGRVIEFNDADGIGHKWAIPAEMLAGDGLDVRRELSRLGLAIGSGMAAKNRLSQYLIESAPKVRARCVQQTGWFDNVFVMPDRTIGENGEVVLYQSESKTACQYAQCGTLDQWRDNVAQLCSGNSRLIFAVSASFAGMILRHAGQESGGVHFCQQRM
jgi:hypothetical protein